MINDSDSLYRFIFEHLGVRGELVRLDASFRAVLERHPYPASVQRLLGEALAAVALLTATLKFEGSLILQAQGNGPLRTLVAQGTHQRTVRGLARWRGDVPNGGVEQQFGAGRLVLTLDPLRGERYQGIVPLQGDSLGAAVEAYFGASEQLPTRMWLAVDGRRAAGLMLQRIPGSGGDDEHQRHGRMDQDNPETKALDRSGQVADVRDADGWNRTRMLADTVSQQELLSLSAQALLRRLFHEEDLRLFEPEPVAFRCGCSRARIADTLRALGQAEVDQIIQDEGSVGVTCEFCNRDYRFDAVDARELFADAVVPMDIKARRH
jgi:molecular chaperone Hsp33